MNADVVITGGAGVFASMSGDADFASVSPVSIMIPNPNGGGPSMFLRNVLGSSQIRFANANTGMSGMALDNSKEVQLTLQYLRKVVQVHTPLVRAQMVWNKKSESQPHQTQNVLSQSPAMEKRKPH